jgi:hypothetical protein
MSRMSAALDDHPQPVCTARFSHLSTDNIAQLLFGAHNVIRLLLPKYNTVHARRRTAHLHRLNEKFECYGVRNIFDADLKKYTHTTICVC